MVFATPGPQAIGHHARRRGSARGHQHRRGVLGRGRDGARGARPARRRRDRHRADGLQRLGRLPRLGVRRDHRARTARPCRGKPTRLARRRRRSTRSRRPPWSSRRSHRCDASGSQRDGFDHPFLSRPALLPTMARSGEWPVTYPATCDLTIAVMYLPMQADERKAGGADVKRRGRAVDCTRDRQRRSGSPSTRRPSSGGPTGSCRSRSAPTSRSPRAVLEAGADVGRTGEARRSGLLVRRSDTGLASSHGIPSIAYGPPGFDADGVSVARTWSTSSSPSTG